MDQSKRLTKEEIKSDQFVETTWQAYQFFKANLKPIIIGAAIVILVVAGFAFYQQQQQSTRAEAFLKYTQAVEKYQEAESDWLDAENAETSGFQAAETQFQTIFQRFSGTPVADKARYNYAKTLYYQGDYDGAITHFQAVVNEHQPENQILALYAQKATGACYEQKGEYQKAIEAYTPAEDRLPQIAMRDYAFSDFQLSQARCYEQLSDFDNALAIYKDIIDLFEANLEKAIQQKSEELIPGATDLIEALSQPPDVTAAERLENEGNYHDAFAAYTEAIHDYKVDKDIHGGLTDEQRGDINRFEKAANAFLKNLRDARRAESEGRNALYYYVQAVGLGGRSFYEKVFGFAPSRKLYEKALFCRDKLQHAQK